VLLQLCLWSHPSYYCESGEINSTVALRGKKSNTITADSECMYEYVMDV